MNFSESVRWCVSQLGAVIAIGLASVAFPICSAETSQADAGLEHIARLKTLRRLDLCRTSVSDAGIMQLKSLGELQQLDVTDTKVSDQGAAKLRRALPACEIIIRPAQPLGGT